MPITLEQINRFSQNPFPRAMNPLNPPEGNILKGREALVVKFGEKALKRYALLDGKSVAELSNYGNQVNKDEADLLNGGFAPDEIPDSHFFISESGGEPQLFAIQPWINGRTLNKVPLKEILANRSLRRNLADTFLKSRRVYHQTGLFPDLIGGDRVGIGPLSFQDPRKILWPFRSPNILVEGDKTRLVDAKKLTFKPSEFRYQVARAHSLLTFITAKILKSF